MDDRYQYQNRLVKLYRWVRYRPSSIVVSLVKMATWYFSNAKLPHEEEQWFLMRGVYVWSIWFFYKSQAAMRMKYYYTLEEVLKRD